MEVIEKQNTNFRGKLQNICLRFLRKTEVEGKSKWENCLSKGSYLFLIASLLFLNYCIIYVGEQLCKNQEIEKVNAEKWETINDLEKNQETYDIIGGDPYWCYNIEETNIDKIKLTFSGELEKVDKIQVFWATSGNVFSQENSLTDILTDGSVKFNISKDNITKLRIDIESEEVDTNIFIEDISVQKKAKNILLKWEIWVLLLAELLIYYAVRKYRSKDANFLWSEECNSNLKCIIIYIILLIIFGMKMNYYVHNANNFSDEIQQVSYIAYLEQNSGKIIPTFEDMYILEGGKLEKGVIDTKFTESNNYLGHPPLYYQIMRICRGVTISDDVVTVNIDRLRMFSQIIALIGVGLGLYIGYSRIKKFALRVLYGVIYISIPALSYGCAGVNNDALAILGVNLFFIGLLRFFENKREYVSYFLIAIGMGTSLFTKLTVGSMLVFTMIICFFYFWIKEKNVNFLFNKYFGVTLWIYVIVAVYFLFILCQYHVLQPDLKTINPEQYLESGFYVKGDQKNILSLKNYVHHFRNMFILTWTGWASNGWALVKKGAWYSLDTVALLMVLILTIAAFLVSMFQKKKVTGIKIFTCGIICTMIYHIYTLYSVHLRSGYLGACNSRYYLCVIAVFAMANIIVVNAIYEKFASKSKILQTSMSIIVISSIILFTYEDIIFFVLNYNG